jgi:hypothetical protein
MTIMRRRRHESGPPLVLLLPLPLRAIVGSHLLKFRVPACKAIPGFHDFSQIPHSPRMWFVKMTLAVDHCIGKLAGGNIRLPYPAHKGRMRLEHRTVVLMRIEDSNWQVEFGANNTDWLGEVGVVSH